MSIPPYLRADPLSDILIRRGESSADSYEVAERAAIMQHDGGLSEMEAIESALGYIPLGIRAELEKQLDQKERADV